MRNMITSKTSNMPWGVPMLQGPLRPQLGIPNIAEIRDLIERLPADDAKEYFQRLQGCLDQIAAGSILTAYSCLDDLYDDVRAAVKALEEPERPKPAPPPPDVEPKPEAGTSPLLIAGGVAVVGLLGYLALK